jgi:uncharacterized damage-inducible protein DinB
MPATKPHPDSWADYSAPLRAILDEYARAIRDLEAVMRGIDRKRYEAESAPDDPEYPSIQPIMEHVIGAGNSYVDYIEDAIAGVDRGRRPHEYDYSSLQAAMASVWEAFGRTVAVLGTVKHFTDDDTVKVQFVTRWNQRYDLEQILEHAIVHILRHRRQIENRLASMAQSQ